MEESKTWHMRNDFEKIPPQIAFKRIDEDDRANYKTAFSELSNELDLLQRAITLFIEIIQGAYRVKGKWIDDISIRASISMANEVLNYVLFIRHSILLGYLPEAYTLFRSCYERTTRCFLFLCRKDQAERFFDGKQIKQEKVDRILRDLESEEKAHVLYDSLRERYTRMSKHSHPNIESLTLRYGEEDIKQRAGKDIMVGGINSTKFGKAAVSLLLQSIILILMILKSKFEEESGKFEKDFKVIIAETTRLVGSL